MPAVQGFGVKNGELGVSGEDGNIIPYNGLRRRSRMVPPPSEVADDVKVAARHDPRLITELLISADYRKRLDCLGGVPRNVRRPVRSRNCAQARSQSVWMKS